MPVYLGNKEVVSSGLTDDVILAQLALKAPLASPALTGVPTAPNAGINDNTQQIATTKHIKDLLTARDYAPRTSPDLAGTPTAPTAAANTDNNQLATTKFVWDMWRLIQGGASEAFDTFKEIQDWIDDNGELTADIVAQLAKRASIGTDGIIIDGQMPEAMRKGAKQITDWDSAIQNGYYWADTGAANMPSDAAAGAMLGHVIVINDQNMLQTVTQWWGLSEEDSATWQRIKNGTAFGPWVRMRVNQDELDARYNRLSEVIGNSQLPSRLRQTPEVVTDWNSAVENGFFYGEDATNAPVGATGALVGFVVAASTTHIIQEVTKWWGFSATDSATWRRARQGENNWTAWARVITNQDELDARYGLPQSSLTDTTADRLMKVGAFGYGGKPILLTQDDDLDDIGSGVYQWGAAAARPSSAPAIEFAILESFMWDDGDAVLQRAYTVGTAISYIRSRDGNDWSSWRRSGDLVAQTSATDATAGSALLVGAFGLGGNAVTIDDDMDTDRPTGFYFCVGPASNRPDGAEGSVVHIRYSSQLQTQLFTVDTGTDTPILYSRKKVDGSWLLWKRVSGDVSRPDADVVVKNPVGFATTDGRKLIALTPEEMRVFAQVMKGGYSGRDYLINGNFRRWLISISQTTTGYNSHDRWQNAFSSSTMNSSRQSFAPGQTDVPGFPRFYVRTNWEPGPDNAAAFAIKNQTIWDVTKLAGKKVTITFWARSSYERPYAVEFLQSFGSGGSPSGDVSHVAASPLIGTAWQRFSIVTVIPAISGKVLGSDDNSRTEFSFWLDAGTNFAQRSGNTGRKVAGWIDLAMISIVDGDASSEILPVSWYDPDIENRRMDAYFTMMTVNMRGYLPANDWALVAAINWPLMRRTPDVILRGGGSAYNSKAFNLYNVVESGCRAEAISNAQGDLYVIDRSYWLRAEG